jgi:hypothetical protein
LYYGGYGLGVGKSSYISPYWSGWGTGRFAW